MRKLIYITLLAFGTAFTCAESIAISTPAQNTCDVNSRTSESHAICRVLHNFMEVHVIFQGPHLRIADNVSVQIFDTNSGALVQQGFVLGNGGGSVEKFSIEGLEPGSYNMVLEGDVFNTEHPFILQ